MSKSPINKKSILSSKHAQEHLKTIKVKDKRWSPSPENAIYEDSKIKIMRSIRPESPKTNHERTNPLPQITAKNEGFLNLSLSFQSSPRFVHRKFFPVLQSVRSKAKIKPAINERSKTRLEISEQNESIKPYLNVFPKRSRNRSLTDELVTNIPTFDTTEKEKPLHTVVLPTIDKAENEYDSNGLFDNEIMKTNANFFKNKHPLEQVESIIQLINGKAAELANIKRKDEEEDSADNIVKKTLLKGLEVLTEKIIGIIKKQDNKILNLREEKRKSEYDHKLTRNKLSAARNTHFELQMKIESLEKELKTLNEQKINAMKDKALYALNEDRYVKDVRMNPETMLLLDSLKNSLQFELSKSKQLKRRLQRVTTVMKEIKSNYEIMKRDFLKPLELSEKLQSSAKLYGSFARRYELLDLISEKFENLEKNTSEFSMLE